jgi:murein DD-endopeptidase MepM/ murein hydrolase activator NlpD
MSSTVCRSAWDVSKSKFLMSVAAAVLLAGCSSEADRFTSGSSGADPVTTASVPNRVTAANVGLGDEISSKPITSAPIQPPSYDYSTSPRQPAYRQPAVAAPQPEIGGVPPAAGAGGTVTVGPGMTLYSVARANNVSVSELAAANGIQPPYSVRTGQRLRIPGGSGAPAQTATFAEPDSTPIVEPKPGTPAARAQQPFKQGPSVTDDGTGATHTVGSGETLFSLGRKFGVSPFAIADANGLPNDAQLAMGQKVRIPAGGTTRTAQAPAPAVETDGDDEETSASENTAKAIPAPAVTEQPAAPAAGQVAEQAPIAGAPGLRWPVRGKVISGFGPKANGLKNEGINIAVPEGTSIRAADSGVVAYAGNELKGYGNLVLIRHENGYVTAYAHAKELFVKRGDTVKRGDVIAKAGQTGSVSSPQLHFEVRKGATALDPMKFLTSSTAAN